MSPTSSRGASTPARLLTIAGSDSGGGAGIQADLKTFAAHGVYGMSVVTAVTAQNTRAVTAIHEIPAPVVAAQIDAVFDDIGVDGIKIGMLASAELVKTVAARLRHHRRLMLSRGEAWRLVLDPVMVAKSGASLLEDSAVAALTRELLPLSTVVTPNLPEAHRWTGLKLGEDSSDQERLAAARAIAAMAMIEEPAERPAAVLIKGGHGRGDALVDLLWHEREKFRYEHRRIATTSTHGTGCTLSSAIAARLAQGHALPIAVGGATDYLHQAILHAYPIGGNAPGEGISHGPVDHLHALFGPGVAPGRVPTTGDA